MNEILKPENGGQVLDAVRWAADSETPLDIVGAGTKRGLGRPASGNATRLDLSALTGIVFYEPEELVIRAHAGTPIADIEALLGDNNQQLAFEPQDLAPLYGHAVGAGTIGGLVACNLGGPRRVREGAARDHVLGFQAVSGRGEAFKSGGRVMKNVTGFDLSKLMAGSMGTLAVMTEVTLKVLPRPEKTRTVLVLGLDEARAAEALSQALGSAFDVSGAAHLPGESAARSSVAHVSGAGAAVTAVRVEGFGPSVAARCASLRARLGAYGETEELHTANSIALWREVRDLTLLDLADGAAAQVWRVSVAPDQGADVAAAVHAAAPDARICFDWGGGLLPVGLGDGEAQAEAILRKAAGDRGGHATCLRAPEALRADIAPFQPEAPGVAALTRRIKDAFDPKKVLNPGRMFEGV